MLEWKRPGQASLTTHLSLHLYKLITSYVHVATSSLNHSVCVFPNCSCSPCVSICNWSLNHCRTHLLVLLRHCITAKLCNIDCPLRAGGRLYTHTHTQHTHTHIHTRTHTHAHTHTHTHTHTHAPSVVRTLLTGLCI